MEDWVISEHICEGLEGIRLLKTKRIRGLGNAWNIYVETFGFVCQGTVYLEISYCPRCGIELN